jgi:hypothetical protein
MGQKTGKKWTAAVGLQPTHPKSDRLLGSINHLELIACAYGATFAVLRSAVHTSQPITQHPGLNDLRIAA